MPSKSLGAALAAALVLTAAAARADLESQQSPPAHRHEPAQPEAARAAALGDDPFAGAERLERRALVAAVLDRNPTLEAARLAHQAALARPSQARSLMDPRLTYSAAPLSAGTGSVPFGQTLEVEQMLPYSGKRRLRGEAAEAEARAAGLGVEELRLELALAASDLFDDYTLVARSLEVNAEHRRLMNGFLEIATARYAAGLLSQQDPLQAEVELAHLVHDRLALEREGRVLVARLNALLHRAPAAPLPPPPAAAPEAPWVAELPAPERLDQQALAARPELAAADAEILALEAERGLARLDRRPDFGVMASYSSMWMDTEHQWMAGVSVNLPVRRERLRAAEAEAEARLAAARSRRLALADALRADVRQAWELLQETHHVLDLYTSRLLPASRDQVQAALTGVETGRNSFLALIEAERNLRSVALGYHETLADYHRRLAAVDRLVGRLPGGAGSALTPTPGDSTEAPPATRGDHS